MTAPFQSSAAPGDRLAGERSARAEQGFNDMTNPTPTTGIDLDGLESAARAAPNRDAMYRRTEEEWEALEDAIMTVYGFEAGRVLSEADVAALALVDRCQRDDNEGATEAYHRGREEGLRERGGVELVNLTKREEAAFLGKMTERTMRAMAEARATTAEALAKEQAETIASLTTTLEYAEDRLHEINVSNYGHDDVCRLNERSVEVILAIRHTLEDVPRYSGGDAVNILHRPKLMDCQEGSAPLE